MPLIPRVGPGSPAFGIVYFTKSMLITKQSASTLSILHAANSFVHFARSAARPGSKLNCAIGKKPVEVFAFQGNSNLLPPATTA
jgi:hypothetical protein